MGGCARLCTCRNTEPGFRGFSLWNPVAGWLKPSWNATVGSLTGFCVAFNLSNISSWLTSSCKPQRPWPPTAGGEPKGPPSQVIPLLKPPPWSPWPDLKREASDQMELQGQASVPQCPPQPQPPSTGGETLWLSLVTLAFLSWPPGQKGEEEKRES